MGIAIARDDWWRIHRALIRDGGTAELIETVQAVIEMGARGFEADAEEDETLDILADVLEDHTDSIESLFEVAKVHQDVMDADQQILADHTVMLSGLLADSEENNDAIARLLLAVGSDNEADRTRLDARIDRLVSRVQGLEEWSEEADDAERIDANVADLEKRQLGLLSSIEGTDAAVRKLVSELDTERKQRQQLAKRVVAQSEKIKELETRLDASGADG